MSTQLDDRLAGASLSDVERRVVRRFIARLRAELGPDLGAVWLYGSRARGETPRVESDVDLMVIAEGGWNRYEAKAIDLVSEAAEAEGDSPAWYSVFVHDLDWLRGRRRIESFFIQEVDRDKVVLAGSALK
jgi:predicted nucleotidyltransferase